MCEVVCATLSGKCDDSESCASDEGHCCFWYGEDVPGDKNRADDHVARGSKRWYMKIGGGEWIVWV